MSISKRYALLACGLVLSGAFGGMAEAQTITRGPYLQMGTESSMIVRWRSSSNTDSVVRYGLSPSNLNQTVTVSGSRREHIVQVSGLSPSTEYYYSIGSTSQTLAGGNSGYRFTTSPNPGTSVPTRIWLIGDSGTANSNAAAVYNAYLNYPGSNNTNLWIMLGDNAYNDGTDSQYQNAVFNMYPELLRRSPLWPTLGNHDGYTANSSTESGPYYDIFSLPRNAEAGGLASGTEAYYSFDYGDIHFICLDSYETSRSTNGAMLTWLRNDIAATSQKWIIAFWHHPPYTKGSHNSDSEGALIDMRQNAVPILESYGVDLVFSGHSHSYERSYLINGHYGSSSTFNSSHQINGGDGREDGNGAYQKADGAANAGAVYTVAGASGKTSGGSLNHPAMFTSLNQLGSVVLDINGNRLDARHLRSNGSVTDYYTLIKGPDTTPPALSGAFAGTTSQVVATFSENVDPTTAASTSNYNINNGISISAANVSGNTVTLTTSTLSEGVTYTLTVNNVQDSDGNIIASNSQANFQYLNIQTLSFQNGVSPTSSYNGTQDTYVASGASGSNFGSSSTILADGSDGSNGQLATLVKWGVGQIPAGSTVTAVDVVLDVFNPSSGSYNLYDSNTSWSEGSATWSSVNPLNTRGSVVGSFGPSSTGSYTISLNAAGVAMVQDWVDGVDNNGLFIMTGGTSDGIDMRSSEYSTASLRPRLIVTYGASSGGGNVAPAATFGFSTSDLQVAFTDQSTDSDGTITSRTWNFGDGNTSNAQNPSHTYASAGTYTVTLTVTDNDGATDSTSQSVTVTSGGSSGQPVTLSLQQGVNGYTGTQDTYVASGVSGSNFGSSTSILADGSDGSNGELVTLLSWDVAQVPAGSTITAVDVVLNVFNPSPGTYNFYASNTSWTEGSATWNSIDPPNSRGSVVGSFGPSSTGSHTISLNAAGVAMVQSWINGSGNNGLFVMSSGTLDGIDMRSSQYGTVSARPRLVVTYESGSGPSNVAPTASFSSSASELQVSFSDSSTDSDGSITSRSWNFGDGNTSTAQNPTHTYVAAGTYTVTLTVTDNDGATDSTSQSVTVTSNVGQPVTVEFRQGLNGYSGAQDTYVAEGVANTNYGNSTVVESDGDDGSRDELIGLFKWDVSSIPAGATVTSASIYFRVNNRTNNVYNLWSMLASWSEGSATWNNTQPKTNRGSFIGSFSATSTGNYTINLNSTGISLVQSWIDGASNNGITMESGGTRNGVQVRSSEYSTQSRRPTLIITYE